MDWKFWQWKSRAEKAENRVAQLWEANKRLTSKNEELDLKRIVMQERSTVTVAFTGKFTPARRGELVASLYGGEPWEALMELMDAEFVAELNGDALTPHEDEKRAAYAAERAGAILALKAVIKNAVAEAQLAAEKEKKA